MVPEEDRPLQERQRAELPHQVGPHRRAAGAEPETRRRRRVSLRFPALSHRSTLTLPSPVVAAQLEGRPGSVRPHPQTPTGPHRLRQAEKGAVAFALSLF